MTLKQMTELLAYINRATGQPIQDGASAVWHDLLGHLSQDEALEALRDALTDTTRRDRWIAPADIMAAHDLIRRRHWSTPPGSAPGGWSPHLEPTYIRFLDAVGVKEILANNDQDPARYESSWRGTKCPFCGAQEQEPCTNSATNRRTHPHPSRLEAVKKGTNA